MKLRSTALLAAIGTLAAMGAATAGPLPTFNTVKGTGGFATAYFIGKDAGDTDTLSIVLGGQNFFINQSTAVGTSFAIGVVANGVEIEFALKDITPPNTNTFFSGPGSRNSDLNVHADVTTTVTSIPGYAGLSAASKTFAGTFAAGTVFVGFEDRPGVQSDFDYNDLVFAVVNGQPATVPEPVSMAILGTGLLGIGLVRRRRAD